MKLFPKITYLGSLFELPFHFFWNKGEIKKLLPPLFTIYLLLLSLSLRAQNFVPVLGLTHSGGGTRAAGMGFAYTAISNDLSAFSWNPAGLSQLDQLTFGLEGKLNGRTWKNDMESDYFDQSTSMKDFWFNSVAIGVPFKTNLGRLSAGLAVHRLYLWNDIAHYPVYSYKHEGDNLAIGLAVAMNLWESLNFGISVHHIIGDMKVSSMEIDFSGNTFELGILYKTPFRIQLGGKFGIPSKLKMDIKDQSINTGWFSFNFTGNYEISIPKYYNIGLAFSPYDKLLIAIDMHSEPWSKSRFEGYNWVEEDINSIHFGIEYNGINIPIRTGYCTVPSAFQDDKDEHIIYHSLNTGTGFKLKRLGLDVSFEYIFGSSTWEYSIYQQQYTLTESLKDYRLGLNITYYLLLH